MFTSGKSAFVVLHDKVLLTNCQKDQLSPRESVIHNNIGFSVRLT